MLKVTTCSKCGFKLPEDAAFCPNCGAPAKKITEVERAYENIGRVIRLGLLGTFLSLIIISIISTAAEGMDLYFVPTFLSALIVIYTSRTSNLKDAVIVSMLIYLLTDAILSGLLLGTLYARGENLASYYSTYHKNAPTLADVILYAISPITAILAGFIGFRIAPRRREISPKQLKWEGFSPPLFYSVRGALKKLKYIFLAFHRS
ncbi:MAG: zinc ribbon domain-containing protein [Candidatus Bathyarchaeia archaeon]